MSDAMTVLKTCADKVAKANYAHVRFSHHVNRDAVYAEFILGGQTEQVSISTLDALQNTPQELVDLVESRCIAAIGKLRKEPAHA